MDVRLLPDPSEPLDLPGGSGAAVLLIHGFTARPASMLPWALACAEAGHTVSVPVLPGHASTWQDLETTPRQAWIDAVERAYDALAGRHRFVAVAGLSMGGTLALHLAAVRRPLATFVVNPALVPYPRVARLAPGLKHLKRTTGAISNDIAKPGQDEGAYDRVPLAAVQQLVALERQVRRELPGIAGPVTHFRSDVDHVVDDASATALRRGLRPGVALDEVALHDSLHVATLDHDAERIERTSLERIAELLARAGHVPSAAGRHRASPTPGGDGA